MAKLLSGKVEKLSDVFRKEMPSSLSDLKSIERRVMELVDRVSPAVVSVRIGFATGSAVVISADGVVLCAAHVCGGPDRDVEFTFPDGRVVKGTTLGTNHEQDCGLMQITDAGKWPHVAVADLGPLGQGDWVLALGHPGGWDPHRRVVVRLGRIIRPASSFLQTDCTLISGDSGGPLFDMHGRVVGIHSRISESTTENFHVPIGSFYETWNRLAKGESWGDLRPPPSAYVGARGVDDPKGCRLERVDANGPAARAGLRIGDVVMKIDEEEIDGYDSFLKNVARSKPGSELNLQIRRDDIEMSVRVTVEARGRRGRREP